MPALLILAIITTFVLAAGLCDFTFGFRQLRRLEDLPMPKGGPRVSVIAAARNEPAGSRPH